MGKDWAVLETQSRLFPRSELVLLLLGVKLTRNQAYFGEVTPLNRGKEFIIRGQPWQRYADVYVFSAKPTMSDS